jgi:hypothetical protein
MRRDEVLSVMGSPKGSLTTRRSETLLFDRGTVTLDSGKVTEINIISVAEQKRRAETEQRDQEQRAAQQRRAEGQARIQAQQEEMRKAQNASPQARVPESTRTVSNEERLIRVLCITEAYISSAKLSPAKANEYRNSLMAMLTAKNLASDAAKEWHANPSAWVASHQTTIRQMEELARKLAAQSAPPPQVSQPAVPRLTTPIAGAGVVKSVIVNDFDGLDYGNLYELQNGQIWKQTEYWIWIWIWIWIRPNVLIYPDGGVWRMKVENIEHAVTVERIH